MRIRDVIASFVVNVNDSQLKSLHKTFKQLNKDLVKGTGFKALASQAVSAERAIRSLGSTLGKVNLANVSVQGKIAATNLRAQAQQMSAQAAVQRAQNQLDRAQRGGTGAPRGGASGRTGGVVATPFGGLRGLAAAYGAHEAGSAAVSGVRNAISEASHAEEALNVIKEVFKKQEGKADALVAWTERTANAMGRSEFDFQEAVGQFGAFLTPNFGDDNPRVAEMSKALTALSADLTSLYDDGTDEDTLRDLKSGMSGETEAVRKYGVDISDSALDAFNAERGDPRTMRALDMKEKAALRFAKIMKDTVIAQGDAVRTADSWANQVRAFQADLKKAAVTLGRELMPTAKKLLGFFRDLVKLNWPKVLDKAATIAAALAVSGGLYYGHVLATTKILPLMSLSLSAIWKSSAAIRIIWSTIALQTTAALIAFLAVEDVIAHIRGQDSVFGALMDEFPLITSYAKALGEALETDYHLLKNFLGLMIISPEVERLIKAGKFGEAKRLIKGTATDGLNRREEERQAKAEKFQQGVAMGGDEGMKLAVENKPDGMSPFDAKKKMIKDRQALVKSLLEVEPKWRGQVRDGSILGYRNGAAVQMSSPDFYDQKGIGSIVPKDFMYGGSWDKAATPIQGGVELGEVGVTRIPKGYAETLPDGYEIQNGSRVRKKMTFDGVNIEKIEVVVPAGTDAWGVAESMTRAIRGAMGRGVK